MDTNWFMINVKKEVFESLEHMMQQRRIDKKVIEKFKEEFIDKSIRDLLDFLLSPTSPEYFGINDELNKEFSSLGQETFFRYRKLKYGTEQFWENARKERDIAYEGNWDQYLMELLDNANYDGGEPWLFLASGDGSEIPKINREIWALDQIDASIHELKSKRPEINTIVGDFENLPDLQIKFGTILALRCITSNTRLELMFENINKVIKLGGCVLCSQPIAYLDQYTNFSDCIDSEFLFDKFNNQITDLASKFQCTIISVRKSKIEVFWLLKWSKIEIV